MSERIRLVLPLPPSVNTYWKRWRGRIVKSDEAKAYQRLVRFRAAAARVRPLDGDVCVTMFVYRKYRRGDLDGFLKLVLDSLQGVAYANDSQVAELHTRREQDPEDPRVVVTIQPASCA